MIHIYEGNGKGKTSCAAGLALRAAGHGIPVIFAQFMKDGSSGEIRILEQLEQVTVVHPEVFYGFYSRMNEEQKKESALETGRMFQALIIKAFLCYREITDPGGRTPTEGPVMLLVMDEVLNAVHCGLLPEGELLEFLDQAPADMEVILTGKPANAGASERADYITSFDKLRHPYDKGITARIGIEY